MNPLVTYHIKLGRYTVTTHCGVNVGPYDLSPQGKAVIFDGENATYVPCTACLTARNRANLGDAEMVEETRKFLVQRLVRVDFLSSIIVTAVEGGIQYWADVKDYIWDDDDDHNLTHASVTIRSNEGDDTLSEWTPVMMSTVELGVNRIKGGELRINHEFRKIVALADIDSHAGEIDSEIADCIVQAGLFGKLVYG